jgi:8-oxo-dGTP pyrophosphatase MutT (NUDIX family)
MQPDEFIARFQSPTTQSPQRDFPNLPITRQAAVLINLVPLLCPSDDGAPGSAEPMLHALFTRRSVHLKHHGGQISFPGGKHESLDPSLMHTAIRETHEEVGFVVREQNIVGSLSQYPTISGFSVTPYVAILESAPTVIIDHNEVSEFFYVPLKYLLNRGNYFSHIVTRNGKSYPIYFLPWQNTYIWGATAGMLINLCSATKNPSSVD